MKVKLFSKCKDGGPESPVDAYVLCEFKNLFSILILKFNKGGREAFHTHAFDALTWFVKGNLTEEDIDGSLYKYKRSLLPKLTLKSKNHRVSVIRNSWCFTIRGAWDSTWTEDNKVISSRTTLTHGRKIVAVEKVDYQSCTNLLG